MAWEIHITWSDDKFRSLFNDDESHALQMALDAFGARATAYAASICGRSDAQDTAQEAFIDLMLLARKNKAKGRIKGLVLTLTRRRAIDTLRRRESRLRRAFRWQKSRKTSESPELPQEASTVDNALASLRQEDQEIIHLRFHAQCSVAESAKVLGVAEGTVKSRLARALTSLREILVPIEDRSTSASEEMSKQEQGQTKERSH